ncbi:MAG TPA: hypothetical protein VFV52_01310 [Bacilli bacterium]|nr:hypothetical protein [Bacilli bacterium]
MEASKEQAPRQKGLGWYSRLAYPLLLAIFVWDILYFEFARQDNWHLQVAGQEPRAEILDRFYELQSQFFISLGVIAVVTLVWVLLVRRDKRVHPEKYRRY